MKQTDTMLIPPQGKENHCGGASLPEGKSRRTSFDLMCKTCELKEPDCEP